jgi:hypothetical protein
METILLVVLIGISVAYFVSRSFSSTGAAISSKLSNIEANTKPAEGRNPELEKPCPQCAETVKRAARTCRFCGHEFAAETIVRPVSVTLQSFSKGSDVLKLLKQEFGITDFAEGLRILDAVPCTLVTRTSPERADHLKALFESKGITLTIAASEPSHDTDA